MRIDTQSQYGFNGLSAKPKSLHSEIGDESVGLEKNELLNLRRLTSKIGLGEGGQPAPPAPSAME